VRAHDAVLQATIELLDEGGYLAATVDAISERSGVSKATIYKHWPSRPAVAAEAFGLKMANALPLPRTTDPLADLVAHVRQVSRFYSSKNGTLFAQILAAGVADPGGTQYFRDFFLHRRREAFGGLWQRAAAAGVVDSAVDAEIAMDVLVGPLIFRLVTGHAPLTDRNAEAIVDAALSGLRAGPDPVP
jgi:AcrR family transcriptional regulator